MKTKVKVVKKIRVVKSVDMTVKDFQRSMGLGKDTAGYIAALGMLRMLCEKGIAKEVARLHMGGERLGRKSVVYRVPTRFTLKARNVGEAAA